MSDDVERARGTARIAVRAHERAGRLVHREQLAAERPRDPLLAVEHDVEREVRCRCAAAIARTSSCTGLPCVTPQRASGCPMRAASCSVSVVSRPARPGATSFGPPEKPAKKCGSTKPVVMRTSAVDPLAVEPDRHVGAEAAHPGERRVVARVVVDDAHRRRAPRRRASRAAPPRVLPRCVPVATSTTTSSRRTIPSSSSSSAGTTMCRGCGRVPSQMLIATVCPGADDVAQRRTGDGRAQRIEHGGALVGRPPADAAARRRSCAPSGSSTLRPSLPYASSTLTAGGRSARAA